MSVLSSKALQEQLSDVLAALTKAALEEICGLVEESHSVLRLEICRSRQENQDLRKKLCLIESIVVRGGGGDSGEVQAGTTEAADRPETPQREREDATAGSGDDGGASGLQWEEVPDVVLIKDEDSDGYNSTEEGDRKRRDDGAPLARFGRRRRRRRRSRPFGDGETSPLKASKLSGGPQSDAPVYVVDSPCSELPEHVRLVQDCSAAPPASSRQVFFGSGALGLNVDPAWTEQPDGVFEYENGGTYGDSPGQSQPDDAAQRKRFACSVCYKTYATVQSLEVHTRIHTGERPFACGQCGKKFTQSAHLRAHMNVHTGERPYGCALCSRSFIVKHSLKLHSKKCHSS